MLICMQHKTKYVDGVCVECEIRKKTITLKYKIDNPVHVSNYSQNLDYYTNKLKELNDRLQKLLKDNECKKE